MTQWFSGFEINIGYWFSLMLIGLVSVLFLLQRLSARYQFLQKQLSQLQNEIRAINSGNLGMGRKISRFAEDIANVEIGNLSQDIPMVSEKSYQQAGLLLSRGATIEEVVESCDIAPAEAELLAIMRHSTPAKTASAG